MQSSKLVSSFAEIAKEKEMDRASLQLIIEDVLRSMIRKRYGADDSFDIIINPDNGDIQILHVRTVVGDYDVEDPVTQIPLTEARQIDEDFDVDDEVASEVSIEDFGRRVILMARQTFAQKIRDIERDNVAAEYEGQIGEIVLGEIYQTGGKRRDVLVIHNKVELILPREEQIARDRYRKGDMLRAIVKEVRRDAAGNPQVIISRAAPEFMERLFEQEVPEIYDGIVEIKKTVREPGERAKVAVASVDDRIDPVGACVGMKGVRIHAVARELCNEGIDVVHWSPKIEEFIKRALSPARPVSVSINQESKRAKVIVRADEVSQAIGKSGMNIRLASQLTGYTIDVYREIAPSEEDVEIAEFADELPGYLIAQLQEIGCDSARAVLELSPEELERRSGFTAAEVAQIFRVIKSEMSID